jgi:hypothetical protein
MDKTKITGSEKCKAYLSIRMDIRLIEKGIAAPNEIRPIKKGVWRSEQVELFQQVLTADLPTVHQPPGIRQARTDNLLSLEAVGTYNSH